MINEKAILKFGNFLIEKNNEASKVLEEAYKERMIFFKNKGIPKDNIGFYLIVHDNKNMVTDLRPLPKEYGKWKGLVSSLTLEKLRVALLNIECNIELELETENNLKLYDRLGNVDNFVHLIDYIDTNFKKIKESIEPYHFNIMLDTISEIEFFMSSKMSDNKKNYEDEVMQLKKKADRLQFFSKDKIEIKIPTLPQESRLVMASYLKTDGLNKQEIDILDDFLRIILNKSRFPKIPKNYKFKKAESRTKEQSKIYRPTEKPSDFIL